MRSTKFVLVAILASISSLFCTLSLQATENTFLGGIQIGKHASRWEARLGGAVFDTGPFTSQELSGGVINGEIVAPSPAFLGFLGSPRPYIGADLAISDNPVHVIYAGFNWEAHLTRSFYLGFSAGGAWNSSPLTINAAGMPKNLGSSLLFHLQASAGVDITPNLTAQVFLNHFSNAGIRKPNHGLESVGARLGYRF